MSVNQKISRLESFRSLKRAFGSGQLRQIERYIAVSRKKHLYIANTFFIRNLIIIYDKRDMAIFKLFRQPITFSAFLRKLGRICSVNLASPRSVDVEKIENALKMVIMLKKKKFIVPFNYDEGKRLTLYRKQAFSKKMYPRSVYIIPSATCNMRCPGCSFYAEGEKTIKPAMMTPEVFDRQWNYVLGYLPRNRNSSIMFCFYGGEPLLNKTMVEYAASKVRRAHRRGDLGRASIALSIVTNGTLINERIAKMLKKYGVFTTVSLDGIGATNDAQRIFKNGSGTYEAIACGAAMLEKVGVQHTFSWTIGPKNIDAIPRDLKQFVKLYEGAGLNFNIMMGYEAFKSPFKRMGKNCFFKKLNKVYDTARSLGIQDQKLQHYIEWYRSGGRPDWFECDAVRGGIFTLGPNGKIGICPDKYISDQQSFRNIEDIGDVRKDAIYGHWCGRTPLVISDCCTRCEYVTRCGGGCPHRVEQITGSIYSAAEETCWIQQFYIERAIIEMCEA